MMRTSLPVREALHTLDLSAATPELFAAMASAQTELENARRNATNTEFDSRYADLASLLDATRPVYSRNGIAIIQSLHVAGLRVLVTTALCHGSGGIVQATIAAEVDRADPWTIGSAGSFLRRYALAALCAVAQADDDAAAAQPRPIALKVGPDLKAPAGNENGGASSSLTDETGLLQRITNADAGALAGITEEVARAEMPAAIKTRLRESIKARRAALELEQPPAEPRRRGPGRPPRNPTA